MHRTVILTGASGFLGRHIASTAARKHPDVTVVLVEGPSVHGVDFSKDGSDMALAERISIEDPQRSVLIHAAAKIEWDSPEALLNNAAMACNVAAWAKDLGVGFSVLVSSVNVYPTIPFADVDTACAPPTFYGLGKWCAEHIWRLQFQGRRCAVVRLAGVWGWQARPTLFWNRALLAAAGYDADLSPVTVGRNRSKRNYVSATDASECLLQIGLNAMNGLFLVSGRDEVDTKTFIEAVESLPDCKLKFKWEDDGSTDEQIYRPSEEVVPWLRSFDDNLADVWKNRPAWLQTSV